MKKIIATLFVSAAALSLAACDSEDVENTPVDDVDEIVDNDVNDDAYPVAGDLNADQQANYDAMDRQAVSDEYDANMADMQSATNAGGGMADGATSAGSNDSMSTGSGNSGTSGSTGGGSMTDDGSDSAASGSNGGSSMAGANGGSSMSGSASGNSMPARNQMDFAYLDRNDDGQLSVAEYAIWALPTNPNPPAPNDALAPHLTQDQINQAGQTFFYFDEDGDTYLSPGEFQAARNSGRTA
ncbi:hypothetical protein [Aurantiacibacter spongiae]|uniref:EF-hand domain-containing protein n=1 Tax=Aurantiacibacter spongiae TaxID=2488860 RepID=A0A3N5DLG9_9SPHN|nr:hypothetical protein [Aurantiacibacter spongiae]RPF72532.1 hypothetical protein EG799_13515 [Aurantiacibacter spongiae]